MIKTFNGLTSETYIHETHTYVRNIQTSEIHTTSMINTFAGLYVSISARSSFAGPEISSNGCNTASNGQTFSWIQWARFLNLRWSNVFSMAGWIDVNRSAKRLEGVVTRELRSWL